MPPLTEYTKTFLGTGTGTPLWRLHRGLLVREVVVVGVVVVVVFSFSFLFWFLFLCFFCFCFCSGGEFAMKVGEAAWDLMISAWFS